MRLAAALLLFIASAAHGVVCTLSAPTTQVLAGQQRVHVPLTYNCSTPMSSLKFMLTDVTSCASTCASVMCAVAVEHGTCFLSGADCASDTDCPDRDCGPGVFAGRSAQAPLPTQLCLQRSPGVQGEFFTLTGIPGGTGPIADWVFDVKVGAPPGSYTLTFNSVIPEPVGSSPIPTVVMTPGALLVVTPTVLAPPTPTQLPGHFDWQVSVEPVSPVPTASAPATQTPTATPTSTRTQLNTRTFTPTRTPTNTPPVAWSCPVGRWRRRWRCRRPQRRETCS